MSPPLQGRMGGVFILLQRYDIFWALCDLLRLTAIYCDLAGRKMLIVRRRKIFYYFLFFYLTTWIINWRHGYKVKMKN